jgi:hypothetical protein
MLLYLGRLTPEIRVYSRLGARFSYGKIYRSHGHSARSIQIKSLYNAWSIGNLHHFQIKTVCFDFCLTEGRFVTLFTKMYQGGGYIGRYQPNFANYFIISLLRRIIFLNSPREFVTP